MKFFMILEAYQMKVVLFIRPVYSLQRTKEFRGRIKIEISDLEIMCSWFFLFVSPLKSISDGQEMLKSIDIPINNFFIDCLTIHNLIISFFIKLGPKYSVNSLLFTARMSIRRIKFSQQTSIIQLLLMNMSSIDIKVVDIMQKQHQACVQSSITGYQLKEYICKHFCKQLLPKEMKLIHEEETFLNNMKVSDFHAAKGKMLVFHQQKIQLAYISDINLTNSEDPIYAEKFSHRWPCGHMIGQIGMIDLIKSIIKDGQYKIRCPYDLQTGEKCAFDWDFKICKKIGVFTKEESKFFEGQLTMNWMMHHTKSCPQCKETIFKENQDAHRVKCPKCSVEFCYKCLSIWNALSFRFCGNQTCKFANQYLLNAPWDRVFNYSDPKNDDKQIQVKTPKYRSCPKCNMIIQNFSSCKHTTCTNCKYKFCWICLSIYTTKWSCGSYKEYCGKVAPVQKFKI